SSPSDFQKDSRLHQSFYGIAYTPEGSQLAENCGNSLDQVITDIQLLSQLTTRIRLYGMFNVHGFLVLEAIKQTEVNMTVWLANYVDQDDGGVAYVRQRDLIKEAIQTYGTDHIGGVTVGNEFILDYLDDHDGTSSDTNGALGDAGAELLLVNITDTKAMLSDINIDLPVGTADAGAYMNKILLEHVDYGMANVHPWFADVSIDIAAGWTNTFFQTDDVELAAALNDTPTMYIAETGWPTNSSSTADETNGVSNATVGNLQIFLDDFVCQANTNETKYFFFEYFDEEWKNIEYGGVEGWWGLFHQNRTLKNVVIPDCVLT
ncbi:glycoside hydrolase family 17 protein, partial [Fistulina hepatica ATCC 64428]